MGKADKKLEAMKSNPKDDWKIEDLKSIAKKYNIAYRQPGTSHVAFNCKNGLALTVPARKPIKSIYIRRFVELIESLDEGNRE